MFYKKVTMFKLKKNFIAIVFILMASCVPNKDLIYLQKTENFQENSINPIALKPYRIQTHDVISLKIKALDTKLVEMFNPNVNQLQMQQASADNLYFEGFSVDDHGTIRIPVLGEMTVIGLTLDEVRKKIEKQLLNDYFKDESDLYVSVKLAGLRYSINGEVNLPGTKVVFQDRLTILDAIANAGDITITGNRKEVLVVRQSPSGTIMETINLTKIEAMNSLFYYVQPNDFIYVKPLRQKSWGTGTNGLQSFTTILSAVSLLVTTIFLFNRN